METIYKTILMKKLVKQIRGVSYKKSDLSLDKDSQHIPVLRANNISGGKLNFKKLVYVNVSRIKKEQLLKKGDILIVTSSGSIKMVGKAAQSNSNLNISFGAFCKLIRPIFNINNSFLGYYFQSYFYRSKISSLSNGANINNIRNEHIDNLTVPLPSLEIQNKIVETLDESQNLIDKRKEQIKLLDDLIKSIFYDMFGDPVSNPKGWERGRIKDLTLKTQYGTSKKANENNGEFEILRMNNITYSGEWDFSKMKYIDFDENEKSKYLVEKGDLLFNRTNSKELVGKTAVYRESFKMAYAGYLVRLRTNSKANSEYISAYLNSQHGKLLLLNMAKSIVGMANINAEELKKIKILIPPIELQTQFAKKVEKIEKQKEKMKKSLTEMENNFNSLMQRAFNGELF